MKVRNSVFLMFFLLLVLMGFAGCEKKETQVSEYTIYYLNKEKTKIVPVAYEPTEDTDRGMIGEMLAKLTQDPGSVDYQKTLSGDVNVVSWKLENRQLQLNFGSDYYQMDSVTEVLSRAAIVRTLIQAEGVDNITFYVGDTPLMNKNGTPVGLMTADSFIENPGEQINSIQTATITLYFSNSQGTGLVQETQECHYNSNISLEKLVIERLMKGPISADGKSVIPNGTKLVSVSVLDGVCFLNLDEGFLNQDNGIEEGVIIYSIVNSLAELSNINKVQISVNGDTSIVYREKFSLSTVYERNLDYVADPAEEEETDDPGEETENGQEGDTGE